jgi:hypothetical protein
VAKLAGAGTTAKLAALCLGSGLAATACVAVGIATAEREVGHTRADAAVATTAETDARGSHPRRVDGGSPPAETSVNAASPAMPVAEPETQAAPAETISPPAEEREFGLVAAQASQSTPDSSLSRTAGQDPAQKGPAIAAQFGP